MSLFELNNKFSGVGLPLRKGECWGSATQKLEGSTLRPNPCELYPHCYI